MDKKDTLNSGTKDSINEQNNKTCSQLVRFREIADTISYPIIYIDRDYCYMMVNQAYADMYQIRRDSIIGSHLRDILGEQAFLHYKPWIDRALTGETFVVADRYKRQDKDIYINELHYSPSIDPDGQIRGVVVVIHDITMKKEALKIAMHEAGLGQRYLDVAGVMMIALDRNGRITMVNRKGSEILGYSQEELLGKNWFDIFVPSELKEELFELYKRVLQQNESAENYHENEIIVRSGRRRLIAWHNVTLFDKDNNVTGLLTSGNDITELRRAQQVIKENEQFQSAVIENLPILLFVKDAKDFRYVMVNKAFEQMFDTSRDDVIGRTDYDLFSADEADSFVAMDRETIAKGTMVDINDYVDIGEKGQYIFHTRKIPIFDVEGRPKYILGLAENITDARKKDLRLQQFATITENTHDGVVITDADNRFVAVNKAFTEITGYSEAEVLGKEPSILKSGRHDQAFYEAMWRDILEKGQWSGEILNKYKDGQIHPEFLTITTINDEDGKVINYVGVFSDLTKLRSFEEKLIHIGMHDPLTGLGNRIMLSANLKNMINTARRNRKKLSLLFLNLNSFNAIISTYGHTVGDKLLIALSKRLLETVRSNDLIAHFGGDEFVIILENNKTPTDVAVSADRILQQVHTPFHINDTEHFIDASIGIAYFPNDAQTAEGLIQAANTAMYIAKKSGNNYEFYDRSRTDNLVQEMHLMSKLRNAVGSDQFVLNYQPQFDMKNGRLIGFEALVRWNHPEMGMVSPVRFIPIAEKTRLIIPLGEQILIEACRQMNDWNHKTGFKGRIAVNVSAVQVEHSNFIDTLKKALAITGLDPNLLEIEITESSAMKNPSLFIELFREIRAIGAHIAIDDFGTGYSSLSYLKRFPLDKLKIDKSFVDDLPHDKEACAIARTIINLAKNLGMSTLAEGVETQEQADYLIREGCRFVQGYLYGKPLVTREAEKRLSDK